MANNHLNSPVPYQLHYSDLPIGSSIEWDEFYHATETQAAYETGTADTDTTNKLIDTTADFSTVLVGDVVKNTDNNFFAKVTVLDSGVALTLDSDAFPNGTEAYSIYRAIPLPGGWANAGDVIDDGDSPFDGLTLPKMSAKKKKIVSSNYTITKNDPSTIYVNPIDAAVEVTMPDLLTVSEVPDYRVELRHYGWGLMDRADCEDTLRPMISGETTPIAETNCTFTRNGTRFRNGSYSYKLLMTATAEGYATLTETGTSLHGLIEGETYTFSAWVYIDTMAAGEAGLRLSYNLGGWLWVESYAQVIGEWTKVSVTLTIPAGTTSIIIRAYGNAADTEFAYFEDFQLYRHYDVTVSGSIENQTSKVLHNEGDFIKLTNDSDKYLIDDLQYRGQVLDAIYMGGGEYRFPDGSSLDYSNSMASSTTIVFAELPANTREVTAFTRVYDSGITPRMQWKRSSGAGETYDVLGQWADGGLNAMYGTYPYILDGNYIYIGSLSANQGKEFSIVSYKVGE